MLALGIKALSEEIDETLDTNPLLKEVRPTTSALDDDVNSSWIENLATTQPQSFEDHLIAQLGYLQLDSESYVAACIIITCLDDSGYLSLSNQALMDEFTNQNINISSHKVKLAVEQIKQLDPAGVASPDLADCLKQQLHRNHKQAQHYINALRICDHLDLLAEKPSLLMKTLNLNKDCIEHAIKLIRQLKPSPSYGFNDNAIAYIQPDILLSIEAQAFNITLNPLINRHIEISMEHVELLKQSNNQQDKIYLRKNLNSARWWMNALAQRNLTLLRVANQMITQQQTYFTTHQKSLKPLTQQTIADDLNLHVSTVSRAIKDKTIQTPDGIIKLNSLLAGRLPANKDNYHSNQSVKLIISELIKNEPSQTPLSDSKIVKKLKKRGIRIARRTVNKYREQLNIPASNLRRIK